MSHANAALTPRARLKLARLIIETGWPIARAGERFQVSWATAKRWAERYRLEGPAGMLDRSSRPHHSPRKTPLPMVRKIVHLRWKQRLGPVEIAARVGRAPSTANQVAHQVLRRCRINRLAHLDRATGEPVRRYEHPAPGDLLHVDVKKLGNIPDGGGWRFLGRAQGERNRAGWVVLIQQTRGDAAKERAVLAGEFAQRVDGLVFSPLRVTADEIGRRSDRTPLVLLGERAADGVADHVVVDNVAAADLAVSHLFDIGRRRVAMISGCASETGDRRSEGYAAALARRGLEVDPQLVIPVRSNRGEEGEAAMNAMLARLAEPPDAVFCITDWVALGVIRSLHLHGLRVPEDVAVAGFDDIPYATASTPTPTSISPDRAAVARAAVESLSAQQEGAREPREIPVGFDLVVRESTAGMTGAAFVGPAALDDATLPFGRTTS